jgi:hypothetical protein
MYYTNKQKRIGRRAKKKTLNCRLVLHDKRNIFNNPKKKKMDWEMRIYGQVKDFSKRKTGKKKTNLTMKKKGRLYLLVDSAMSFLASGMSPKSLTACTHTHTHILYLSFWCVCLHIIISHLCLFLFPSYIATLDITNYPSFFSPPTFLLVFSFS